MSSEALSGKNKVNMGVLRRAYPSWVRTYPESQPKQVIDIHLNLFTRKRPPVITSDKEDIIVQFVLYDAENNIQLTRQGILDIFKDYVSKLPQERQDQIGFRENRPSNNCVSRYLKRNDLHVQHV